MKTAKRRNLIPPEERGTDTGRPSTSPGRIFPTQHRIDAERRVAIVCGESGTGTALYHVHCLWESGAISDLPDGPAFAFTMQAAREWCDRTFSRDRVTVQHCGHPTALWPYLLFVNGEPIVSPNGYAWKYKEDAQNAGRLIAAGTLAVNRSSGEYTRAGRDRSQETCSDVWRQLEALRKRKN